MAEARDRDAEHAEPGAHHSGDHHPGHASHPRTRWIQRPGLCVLVFICLCVCVCSGQYCPSQELRNEKQFKSKQVCMAWF